MTTAVKLSELINGNSSQIVVPSGGIQFADATNANTVANQSNLIEQDGYEQGNWTPTLNTGTPIEQSGLYIKIGNFVWLTGRVSYTITDTSTNYLRLGGLPFTIPSDVDNRGYQVMYVGGITGVHAWETFDGTGNLALSKDGTTFSGNRTIFSNKSFEFKFTYPASVI